MAITRLGLYGGARPAYAIFVAKGAAPPEEVAEGAEGDPWGAWENFAYYRKKYLDRKQREAPFLEQVTAETTTEPLVLEASELGEAVVAFRSLQETREAQLDFERLSADAQALAHEVDELRLARIGAIELEISELGKAIDLARELRRRLDEEIAIVMTIMLLFFGGTG